MTFNDLSLIEPILKALETEGYTQPTPIQEQAIPHVLQSRDLLGCAQTGTGKTAAFAIPILQRLRQQPKPTGRPYPIRSLILTPTRELAIQISESFTAYGRHCGLRNLVIFGGVGQKPQTDALQRGTDILVATPGRLLDLINQGFVNLQTIQIFVLDEADRMLDMGFIHDVKKVIAKLPTQRQTLFFSATMPPEIAKLADSILTDPAKVEVTPVSSTAEKVSQAVYFVEKNNKKSLLIHLLKNPEIRSALVFARTKHGANRIAGDLTKAGIEAQAIHGNKSQNARQEALNRFKNNQLRVLVATDIAARGIDVEELSHVINFELPNVPETYVHRIGRTGRAGNSGIAISFCETEEVPYLKDIQKLTGLRVPVVGDHPFAMTTPDLTPPQPQNGQKKQIPPQKNAQQARPQVPAQPKQQANEPRPPRNQPPAPLKNAPAQPRPEQPKRDERPQKPAFVSEKNKPNERPERREQRPSGKPQSGGKNAPPPKKGQRKDRSEPYVVSRPPSRWDFLSKRIEINIDLDPDASDASEMDYAPQPPRQQMPAAPAQKPKTASVFAAKPAATVGEEGTDAPRKKNRRNRNRNRNRSNGGGNGAPSAE